MMLEPDQNVKISARSVDLFYGAYHALTDVSMDIYNRTITAIIGPSGCGKSSLLRIFNRMNDLFPNTRVEGEVTLDGAPIYGKNTDVAMLRKKIGMVFQKPNVFPMSIYDNIVIGPRRHGTTRRSELREIAERCLSQVSLWGEV
jgi:phosphate transport system ATP-binding protein